MEEPDLIEKLSEELRAVDLIDVQSKYRQFCEHVNEQMPVLKREDLLSLIEFFADLPLYDELFRIVDKKKEIGEVSEIKWILERHERMEYIWKVKLGLESNDLVNFDLLDDPEKVAMKKRVKVKICSMLYKVKEHYGKIKWEKLGTGPLGRIIEFNPKDMRILNKATRSIVKEKGELRYRELEEEAKVNR